MRVLIADDEPLALQRLRLMLNDSNMDLQVVAEVGDGAAAVEACREQTIDLALLDIRMPGMDGISAALEISQQAIPPAVVFVTAYDEHALAAFDANAIDYLLKPIRADRLVLALQKASQLTQLQTAALSSSEKEDALSVTYRGALQRIPLDEVIYLQADSKYVEVCHKNGFALLESSLKAVEEQYPQRFLRIHRNALVAPDSIRELMKDDQGQAVLRLQGSDKRLLVSRRNLPMVRRFIRD